MRRILTRLIGTVLILAGITGLLFSAAGLIILVRVQKDAEAAIAEQLDLVDRALSATSGGLAVADGSLTQAVGTVTSLKTTLASVGTTVNGAVPTFDALASLLGEKLPATVEGAQKTLTSAATSARSIDEIMATVSAIPFLGPGKYNPDVPLSQGLTQLSASLDGIPEALRAAEGGLSTTSMSLQGLQGQFGDMAASVGQIATSLDEGRAVLKQYQGVTSELQAAISAIRSSLAGWLQWLRLGLSLLLIWLGIAQFALITQGWELVGRSRRGEHA